MGTTAIGAATRARRSWAVAVAAWLAAAPATAQFPDVESDRECPACRAALTAEHSGPSAQAAGLTGVWSSALTSADDAAWAAEDFFCFAACTAEARADAQRLLTEPGYAARSALALFPAAIAVNAAHAVQLRRAVPDHAHRNPPPYPRTPSFACDPHGFAAQVLSALPLSIEPQHDGVVLRYEEFGATRTIPFDGSRAATPPAFGRSQGRIDGRTMVVATTDVPAGRLHDWFGGNPHSDQLRALERYTVSDDGLWLDLVLELEDPATLQAPLVVTKRWRRTPNARLASHGCDVMSGQLSNVLAEYVDPASIDARRQKHTRSPTTIH